MFFGVGGIIGDGLGANQGQFLDRNLAGAIDVKSLLHAGAMSTTVRAYGMAMMVMAHAISAKMAAPMAACA